MGASDEQGNSSDQSWSDWSFGILERYFGLPDRPDTRLLVHGVLIVTLTVLAMYVADAYDRRWGFLGGLRHQVGTLRKLGLEGTVNLKAPMTDQQLTSMYARLRELGTIDQRDVLSIRTAARARLSHDAYFRIRPFFRDPLEMQRLALVRLESLIYVNLLMVILPIFAAGYVVWFLMMYFQRYLVTACWMFFVECVVQFIIDWIVAEVKKIIGDAVNIIVKIVTLGFGGNVINVTMPNFSDYWNRWWASYVQPMLDDMSREYTCRFDDRKERLAELLETLFTPINKVYAWFVALKRHLADMPYAEFKSFVLATYPGAGRRQTL
ncbi:g845 [Coccomyxa elongata]